VSAVDPRLVEQLEALHLPLRVVLDVYARLEAGAAEYGDESLHRSVDDLLSEVLEELRDTIGWTTLALARLAPAAESPPGDEQDPRPRQPSVLQRELRDLCRSAATLAQRCEWYVAEAAAIEARP
jgi:hypothetical protein